MKLTRVIAVGVIVSAIGLGQVQAQSLKKNQGPAEIPPASFKGKQYVDSKGCVYIRAGVDGLTTWVPRVSRSRQVICGFKPTVIAQGGTTAPAPAERTAGAVQIQPAQPVQATKAPPVQVAAAPPVRRTPAPAPRKTTPVPSSAMVIQPAGTRFPVIGAPTPAAPLIQPAPVAVPAPRRVVVTAAPTAPGVKRIRVPRNVCQGASAVSARYLAHDKYEVRCGPQAELPYTRGAGQAVAAAPMMAPAAPVLAQNTLTGAPQISVYAPTADPATTPAGTRVVRRHVYENRVLTIPGQQPPPGYAPVWKDDRLNPYRAEGTFQGERQMTLVWTKTVPRRLIDVRSGADVTAKYPQIRYPQTAMLIQPAQAPAAYISSQGRVKRAPVVAPAAPAPAPTAHVSTKSTPPAATRQLKREVIRASVQVGTYGDAASATKVARDIQRLGLKARIGRMTRNGQQLRIVVAGPFASQVALDTALRKVRGRGYRNAFIRK